MINVVNYLLGELKVGRLAKADVLQLLMQHQHGIAGGDCALHPLLQRNTSTLNEQRFSSTLSDEAFYLSDHVVRGNEVLPGVAYLEMARAAVERSAGLDNGAGAVVTLHNVVWVRPVVVSEASEVHIALTGGNHNEIEFEIYSMGPDATSEEVIHAQGRAVLRDADSTEAGEQIDLSLLRSQCDQLIEIEQCYAAFSAMGIEYGPAHRGLTSVQVGTDTDGQRFVLAHVTLPQCVHDTQDQYVLHPSVLDSALQASIGFSLDHSAPLREGAAKATLPFALEQLQILDRSPAVAMVVVRSSKTSNTKPIANGIQKLDIDLCDESGRVCMRFKGFTSRVLETELSQLPASDTATNIDLALTESSASTMLPELTQQWQPESMVSTLLEKTLQYLKRLLSVALKLPADRIESDVGLERYGIDSILALKLVNELEVSFGSLPKTLMFEYQSIEALAGYFMEHHREALSVHLKLTERALVTPREFPSAAAKAAVAVSGGNKRRRGRFAVHTSPHRDQHADQAQASNVIDIAIIGLSGRYPGANNVAEFWENLKAGKDCITEIPKDRWDYREYFDAEKGKVGKSYSKWGGFIEGVDQFDPLFFNISPLEAQITDPQERLFLQCVYQTLEDAGYTRETLKSYRATGLDGNVGVFVGVMYEEYQLYGAQAQALGQPYALGGNPSSIANRVSYFCNFHGPSMAVDTMCSSSLTAIHLACESIKHQGCELAIAGGVNVSVHPNKYLMLSQGQFASSTGRCESFGQGGDGYVPGEGVGAVLLKPLSKAIEDHDHIYGVIKGTAINHGGKTNGYTVPNPQAQAQVIAHALKEAQVDPRTISYIEAHGTGTSLGDPIEIAGLTKAFSAYTEEKQYCAIGSAKSNIGHLESAAGIAGLTKILLQMQHRTLVPSLHSQTLNPHIDFSRTPFKVQQTVEEWHRPLATIDGQEREYPRIAGISSFGAGGANAHVIIEEYCVPQLEEATIGITSDQPALIVLSAKNEERLQAQVKQLLAYISTHSLADADLAAIAYTLQVGREAMEHRLALTVVTLKDFQAKLSGYLEGKVEQGAIEECYRGEVKKNKEALSTFTADEELQEAIGKWVQRGKYTKLLDLWVKGLVFDWSQLYNNGPPRRISLPTYPFAKERYWIEANQDNRAHSEVGRALHPLLQQNTSDVDEQRFSSTFSGEEFYLSDHVVSGSKVLPGVCYLEMARAAVQFGVRQSEEHGGVTLRNIVWQRPVIVGDEQAIHIGLNRTERGEVEFEIYSVVQAGAGEPEEVIHAQGQAVLLEAGVTEVAPMDLSLLRGQCDQSMEVEQCYAAFSAMGIEYGPAHRGLTSVQVGTDTDGQRFVLAHVTLPGCVSETQDQYVLHPSVLDSALQASLGLSLDQLTVGSSDGKLKPSVPFALEQLEVFDRSPSTAWVVVRPQTAVGSVQKLDIEIGDESGRVCVRMQGFTSRVLESEVNREQKGSLDRGVVLTTPSWQPKPLTAEDATSAKELGERWVVMESIYKERLPVLQTQSPAVNWAVLPEASEHLPLMSSAQQLFTQVQSILQSKPRQAVLLQVVVAEEAQSQTFTSVLSGLLKSAHQENPKFLGQVIALPSGATTEQIAGAIEENASQQSLNEVEIRYVGVREVRVFKALSESTVATQSPWKDGGVYLITGGAGGLGLIVAGEIAKKTTGAKVILTGRSELSTEKQAHLDALKQRHAGTKFNYRELDVSDADAVTNSIHAIVEQYGALNGIVHSAGVIHDNFIIKKTPEEFRAVLAPKVLGTLNLDRATQSMDLDCFILFSSTSGVFGNVGQSDYATANAFMDCYAAYRNERVEKNQRHGRTLSINWPLWENGGMQVDDATRTAMRRQGLEALTTADGIDALYRAWSSDASQVMVLVGEREKLRSLVGLAGEALHVPRRALGKAAAPLAAIEVDIETSNVGIDTASLLEKVRGALIQLISQQLKVKVEDIDVEAELSEFGFDSISLTAFGNTLNQVYGLELSPTIFFEYPSVHRFAEYLVNEHTARLSEQFVVRGVAKASAHKGSASAQIKPEMSERISTSSQRRRRRGTPFTAVTQAAGQASGPGPIAIIGMSGCFPGAADVEAFWENLKSGKDSITEIPKSRWDWQAMYGDPTQEANKTNVKWGGFIDGVDEFDPLFFNISPREAESMDPAQRLLMTYTWKAIEDAGYAASSLSGSKTAIFVGTASSSYSELAAQGGRSLEGYSSTSGVSSIGPNRMSYLLNLHGPSEPIETACSSSLVAIHRAVRAMQTGDCEMALVGGINTIITPWAHLSFSKAGMLCEDGRCKTFSKDANGYVRGEGVGMLFLKKLSQAERDGDYIYGLIKGSSENHGGRANSLTAPNPKAQAELIKAAYREAKIDPRTVSYIETHGTGTPLGDPIEINGLKSAFSDLYQDRQLGEGALSVAHCGLGSVKTNIGHLELAAGVASVIKVLLQLKHKTLVKSLHCEEINPYIELKDSPFYLVNERQSWAANTDASGRTLPRRAGVSSFGFGGVNAHVIIEEYVATDDAVHAIELTPEHPALIVLSAKSEAQLKERIEQLLAHIQTNAFNAADLVNVAYTLQVGREAMEHRLAFTVVTLKDLQAKLSGYLEGKAGRGEIEECYRGEVKKNKEALSTFTADEELQEAIGKWVQRGKYTKLLDLWVKGLVFDWSQLYNNGPPRRISLPTYPFAKDRYWIDMKGSEGKEGEEFAAIESFASFDDQVVDDQGDDENVDWLESVGAEREEEDGIERWVFIEEWSERAIGKSDLNAQLRIVVVGLSDETDRREFAAVLRRVDERVQMVFVDQREGSYGEAIGRIQQEPGGIDAVWYVQGLAGNKGRAEGVEIVDLLQGIAGAGIKAVKVLLAGEYGSAVERSEMESWLGYARSVYRVLPQVQVAVIQGKREEVREEETDGASDAGGEAVSRRIERWARRLLAESHAEQSESALYIGEQRQVLGVKPVALSADAQASVLRTGGTYLITGGLGGLGYLFAEYLARQYSAKLILTGRSSWDEGKQAKLDALSAVGGEALYIAAQVSNPEQMRAVIEQGRERFGILNGVIHAAGVESSAGLLNQTRSSIEAVLLPKVTGTRVLSEVLQAQAVEAEVDFICYFSSTSAVLGDFGSCDYAVGNRYELAYAKYVEPRALAICWPMWAEGGMGLKDHPGTQLYLKSSGLRLLQTEEGVEIFEQLLSQHRASGVRHAVVMVGEKRRVYPLLGLASPTITPRVRQDVRLPVERNERRGVELRGLTLEQQVLWEVQGLASELLKLSREQLEIEENLAEFGFDSIGLASFAKQLSAHYGIDVLPSVFFSHPTLKTLSDYLLSEHAGAVQRRYESSQATPSVRASGRVATRSAGAHRSVQIKQAVRTEPPVQLEQRVATRPRETFPEPIAIIGMSGRFPGARNVEALWQLLVSGTEAVQEIPRERFDWRGYYQAPQAEQSSTLAGKTLSKWLGAVPGVDEFDPLFFEVSPKEAEFMDPRQRLLLQESFKALEDAGYGTSQLNAQTIGMFVGVEQGDYQMLLEGSGAEGSITANHDAILASRLSYFLNLQGPAMAINTACSSGLVAAHQACQSLRSGDCDTAMAASVNLILTPHGYIGMSQAGMLSPDGKCYAFDRRANGMVPGEAVVALVLKRLSQAQADQDRIVAVIRGSGINYDGKTNGLTAPSGAAQTALIQEVYARSRVKAQEIEYIVTHGTGTRLGDPVEINALREVFKEASRKEPFCALTSTKTNVGHTFAASGLVSLIGLVQSMRHETIPASLHCEQLSDYIDWKNSPFYVNTQNKAWPKQDGKPRLGAVSAFGMSGTNAHMVVESYERARSVSQPITAPYYLLALSAKTEAALQERARDLLVVLEDARREWGTAQLAALSHTLLNHRQHFNHRCAVLIEDREQAVVLLEKIGRNEKWPTLIRGKVSREFAEQPLQREYAIDLLAKLETVEHEPTRYQQSLSALADLYCQGYQLNWRTLYGDHRLTPMSLPTYPFAKERYWVPASLTLATPTPASARMLHPLLHRNTSTTLEQRFTTVLTGDEFFLADHVLNGIRLLPGVTHLEMARMAALYAADIADASSVGIRLKDVVFVRPIVVTEQPVEINIVLHPHANGELVYEIYSGLQAVGAEKALNSKGIVQVVEKPFAVELNLATEREQCGEHSISHDAFYSWFKSVGFDYGPTFSLVDEVYVGNNRTLAKLVLPESVVATMNGFVLYPGMMDASLQSTLGLTINPEGGKSKNASIPFAFDEVEVFGPCTSTLWVIARFSDGSRDANKVKKLDLSLCDQRGRLCVAIRGFSVLEVKGDLAVAVDSEHGTLLLRPVWKLESETDTVLPRKYSEKLLVLCGLDARSEIIEAKDSAVRCLALPLNRENAAQDFSSCAQRLLQELQGIVNSKPIGAVLVQVVVAKQDDQSMLSGLAGMLRTAQLENPNIHGQFIELDREINETDLLARLLRDSGSPADQEIRYQDDMRWVRGWSELAIGDDLPSPWKSQGVYLITGGAGGLGLIFAREIAKCVAQPTLVLTGRSKLSADMQAQLQELESLGARVEYQSVDVANRDATDRLIQKIQTQYGALNGIIHAAGVVRDSYLLKKTYEELRAVFEPKVTGLVNLDWATRESALDVFVCFSSVAVRGNVGQADYSAANGFMDAYAAYRNQLMHRKQRHGHTVSINWPLWRDGGMQVDSATLRLLVQHTGMVPMSTTLGMQAFYRALSTQEDQVLVMEGDVERLKRSFFTPQIPWVPKQVEKLEREDEESAVHRDGLQHKALNYFKKSFAASFKFPIHSIDVDEPLEKYGIDSIMVTELTFELEKVFGPLSRTLLFEYQTIRAVTSYFVEAYRAKLFELFDIQHQANHAIKRLDRVTLPSDLQKQNRDRFQRSRVSSESGSAPRVDSDVFDVAIIGLSGRYPGANNVDEFWENLKAGKDCITEIPPDRWDYREYFDPEKSKTGKTYSKWGGFIEGADDFDSLFFNISPRDAKLMDPQIGLYMVTVWELLEVSGYTRRVLNERYGSRVGLYVGTMYQQHQNAARGAAKDVVSAISSHSAIANRVSHFFGFNGPSVAVDTMCSSSMMAIHLACKDLLHSECELAIAGGVNLSLDVNKYIGLSQAQFLGSGPHCRSFAEGDGYLPAEAVGAVLLKRLSTAIADQDEILAVIRASAANHSGNGSGFAVADLNAQADLIGAVIKKAMVEPWTISYVEAAATGSVLSDAIEIRALEKAFAPAADRGTCALGSVKSNIGHAEAASGMSQLTKVVLQLRHGVMAPTYIQGPINPNLNLDRTPFYLQNSLQDWARLKVHQKDRTDELPRRALINSFGAGGSYVSMVVEEYVPVAVRSESFVNMSLNAEEIIVLSAQDGERLRVVVERLLAYAKEHQELALSELAYTLQTGREAMQSRVAWVLSNRDELIHALQAYLNERTDFAPSARAIQTYQGERDDSWNVKSLFSGSVGLEMTATLLSERSLAKIALLWAQGGEIAWRTLHQGRAVRKIALPTYPFRKKARGQSVELTADENAHAVSPPALLVESVRKSDRNCDDVQDYLVGFLVKELGIESNELNLNRDLREYGIDSLIGRRLLRGLDETFGISVTGKQLIENSNVASLLVLANSLDNRRSADATMREEFGANTPLTLSNAPISGANETTMSSKEHSRPNHSTVDVVIEQERWSSDILDRVLDGSINHEELSQLIEQGSIV